LLLLLLLLSLPLLPASLSTRLESPPSLSIRRPLSLSRRPHGRRLANNIDSRVEICPNK
jgi:hypothetical protein